MAKTSQEFQLTRNARRSILHPLSAILVFLAGCGNAVNTGHNTALDDVDLVAMTDDMAAKIVADPQVQQAVAERGKLKIVVQPVENLMRAEILPAGPATAFTGRIRMLLSKHAPDRFTWIMNRDGFYRLRSTELEGIDPGPAPDAINPEYALTARFNSLADENAAGRNAYYLCVYELNDLQTRSVLWSGSYEVKKKAVRGFLD